MRLKSFRRLFADDALVMIAWLMLASNALIWQLNKDALYTLMAVSNRHLLSPPKTFVQDTERYLRCSTVIIAFFYSGLWSVKLSFLILFRRLGHRVQGRGRKIQWWTVLGITVASYFAVLGTIQYHCLTASFQDIMGKKKVDLGFQQLADFFEATCTLPSSVKFARNTLRYNMIIDVVTDALSSYSEFSHGCL